jgi:hypothetical protein
MEIAKTNESSPTEDQGIATPAVSRRVKLTKSGKPDGRSISSKKNLEIGKKKVMDILHKAKQSKIPDEEETDDEEFEIKPRARHKGLATPPLCATKGRITPPTEGREVVPLPLQVQEVLPLSSRVVTDPYIDEIEMTKKELQELKRQVQENRLREESRKQLEIQKQVDKIRMEAYGRLNSLSQNMSMKF